MKKIHMTLLCCLILAGLVCTGCQSPSAAQLEENKALIRRCYDVMEKRDWEKYEQMHTPDFVYHTPYSPKPQTREYLINSMQEVTATFPDWHTKIEDIIAEGDKVTVRKIWQGTNEGELKELKLPATGKEVSLPMIIIFRIKDGKIAETWETYDRLSGMKQLGVMPSGG